MDSSTGSARGVWQSIFYSAIFGWFVLLAITFAVQDPAAVTEGGGTSLAVFEGALSTAAFKAILIISTIGQLFCGLACLTSRLADVLRVRARRRVRREDSRGLAKVNEKAVPYNAVIFMAICALLITLPALKGTADEFPFAFFAVVSITVIGLYIAFAIPIYLRWRAGDSWDCGRVVARQALQVDEPVRGHLDRDHHGHLLPAVHAGGGPVGRHVRPGRRSTTRRSPSRSSCS